jgi:tagatose 6-phosphate kinase
MPMILAAGLTPAFQQVLTFDTFTPGEVNRAREVQWCASGKVLNVARALYHLGVPSRALTVVGGNTGAAIERDFQRLGIAARWIVGTTPTRVCTTILDSTRKEATELVPNAAELTAAERDAFIAAYAEEAAAADLVVLIGSLPVGTATDFYRRLLQETRGRAILDVRGPELLDVVAARPFLVKPNRAELAQTFGRGLQSDDQLLATMKELNHRGAEWVVVTSGRNPLFVSSMQGCYRLHPPAQGVVNPIGCGDCMAAGIAAALAKGSGPLDAIRYGAAVAAEKVSQALPGVVAEPRVQALVNGVRSEQIC